MAGAVYGVPVPMTLVLLRHGQSTWNAANRFTGWFDADLSDLGRSEAVASGQLMAAAGVLPTVVHTSLLVPRDPYRRPDRR